MVQAAIVTNYEANKHMPMVKPRTGWYAINLAIMAVIGGFLFGYDTGVVSGSMLYVAENKGMKEVTHVWAEIIVSITPGFATFGALLSGYFADRLGRKKLIIASSIIFTVGSVVCAAAPDKYTLIAGRILLGVAIGFASMIVPIYVGEVAPSNVRGLFLTMFQLLITFGMMASNIISGVFSYIDPANIGWRMMFGFAGIPAIIQFIGFLFLPESPRWLYNHGRKEEAEEVLRKIYVNNKEWIDYEMHEISVSYEEDQKARKFVGDSSTIARVFKTKHVLKALIIGSILQALQQFAGINTIMYYTGAIIQSAGVRDKHDTIWIAAAISAVNFVATFIPMYLIDRIGRRILLLSSIVGIIVSLLAMSGAFVLINNDSYLSVPLNISGVDSNIGELAEQCNQYSNCDYCVTNSNCGFCESGVEIGTCAIYNQTSANLMYGPCSPTSPSYNESYTWAQNYCHTKFTILPIIVMVIYLISFASGFGPLAWTLNAEFFPSWARGTCCSITTGVNWIFNLLVSLTFLSLSEAVNKYGAFLIYAAITSGAFVFCYIFIPETKDYSIEEIELLFMSKKQRAKHDAVQNRLDGDEIDIF